MKYKIIAFCLLLVTIMLSCKKEEMIADQTIGKTNVPLLVKVLTDNKTSNEFIYNDSNMISQEQSKFDLAMYHYNATGKLSSSEYYGNDDILSSDIQVSQNALNSQSLINTQTGKKGGNVVYEYASNGQLIKTSYSQTTSGSTEYSEFNYDSNDRIAKQTMFLDNTATGYINYTYDYSGNLVKETLYALVANGPDELITTTQYEFDDQANPFKPVSKLMIPGINTNQNNIIKETCTLNSAVATGSDNIRITQNEYEYNDKGYPLSMNGNVQFIYK